jgi:hypothetical protein
MRLGGYGVGSRVDDALLLCPAARIELARAKRRTYARRAGLAAGAPLAPRSSLGTSPNPRRGHVRALLDAAGRRRSPATLPEFHAGRPLRIKGMRYPGRPAEQTRMTQVAAAIAPWCGHARAG